MYAQVPTTCTAANITLYNITVMDQYTYVRSPAIVTVPGNMLSVEIYQFLDNGTNALVKCTNAVQWY